MTVTFLDPRAEPGSPVEPYELGIDVTAGPVTIGMLANGFPDSVNFLRHVEAALAEILPQARFRSYDKGNASAICSNEMLDGITAECAAVVTAYGH
jgi:hypothetical protein